MTSATVIRSAVSMGWVINAILIERIVTRGGITDMSEIGTNGPIFALVGVAMVISAAVLAIAAALGWRTWPTASLVAGVIYLLTGVWLRFNGDDSGAAIALAAAAIATLALLGLAWRRRPAAQR